VRAKALKRRYGRASSGGARFYALIGKPKLVYGPFNAEREAEEIAETLALPNEGGCVRVMTAAQAKGLGVPVIERTA
jgi:hypothetical protein